MTKAASKAVDHDLNVMIGASWTEEERMESFGVRFARALDERGPLCVGIDPHAGLLHAWGLPDTPDGLARFCDTVVEALADRVAVLKPQSAFFERFGSAGFAVLESTIRQSRERGALVLCDTKRGDIDSTAQAYAEAFLSKDGPLYSDAITVSPYLGFGSIMPFIELAQRHGGGVFVLALTSNPDGPQVQHARTTDGRTVAQMVLDEVAVRNAGADPVGSVGVVIGATIGPTRHDVTHINAPVLVPGMGAQGGTPADLRSVFRGVKGLLLPSYSREVLAAGPSVEGLREAAARSLDECRKVLNYPIL
jgi:orotidine-5'-phosphate decarboxylase